MPCVPVALCQSPAKFINVYLAQVKTKATLADIHNLGRLVLQSVNTTDEECRTVMLYMYLKAPVCNVDLNEEHRQAQKTVFLS